MLHGSKGSIKENEDMEDALRMDNNEPLLNELLLIKEMS